MLGRRVVGGVGWDNRKDAKALSWDGGWWLGWVNRKGAEALGWDGGWWVGWDNRKDAKLGWRVVAGVG